MTRVAAQHQKDMPYLIQYFVNSLGRDAASCSDLMSYLLFTPKYTRDLIELGYHDANERIDEIEDYLYSADGGDDERALWCGTAGIGKSRPVTAIAETNVEPQQDTRLTLHRLSFC